MITCVGTYVLYENKSKKLEIAEWNLKTQNDTIKTLKNKAGENVYKINSLILSVKDLKKNNSDLSAEIDKLSRKDKKNLVEINKLNLSINLLNDSIKKLQSSGN
jgi:peptidoglycan hydrolase CwlO-like protein